MTKNEAKKLIKYVFTHKFQTEYFEKFISNIFKDYKPLDISREGQSIKDAFKPHVAKYKIIGTFSDAENNDIDILLVALNNINTLQRARTLQRNFVADYLNSNGKEAAMLAFITNKDEWRFSLVKLDHSLEIVDEKIKTKKEITPARRWSFLVGRNEGSHTAQSRFIKLLTDNEKPSLAELESAFNIESVTKEFFDRYTQLYFALKEHLDSLVESDEKIKKDFEGKEISTVDFAKKTLGQIVFLYFLQKKGWFGVAADKDWGSGPKNFLRELFNRRENYGKNFFNDILEPLFYEALAQDRGEDAIYTKLNNVRMPFLNGGLFEPMNNYQWETTDIVIPDELFSNEIKDAKTGDTGNGILDVFDRYNFTVNENEPLEQEVAVDPEMLGKVFENLLEIKDRKSKGAFYTPREIVHYMCQETLINYLETETTDISRDDIEFFIRQGELILENDKTTASKIAEKEDRGYEYKGDYTYLLPQSIINNATEIDKLLYNIKVADPAVGSGAFPLGMLNEIVRARRVIGVHTKDNKKVYTLKKETISNSLYGVDIDPGAVEIAKLRLWLSLVVDENKPHPLPNLDHKIMQGNSLISEYEGIKLFDDSIFGTVEEKDTQIEQIENRIKEIGREIISLAEQNIYSGEKVEELEKEAKSLNKKLTNIKKKDVENPEFQSLFDEPEQINILEQKTKELTEKTAQYISESGRSGKQSLKRDIDKLKWDIIEMTLRQQGHEDKVEELKGLRRKNIKPFFIWKLEFADVFKSKEGFDVVIGNPPYVGEKGNKDIFRPVAKGNLGKYYQGKMDLFYFFFHLALDLGRKNTQNAFITTNYYITALGARKFRADLKERSSIRNLINFNELRIFESALGQHNMITIFSKGRCDEINAKTCITKRKGTANEEILNAIVSRKDKETDYFNIDPKSLYDGKENYIRLSGIGNFDSPIEKILEKIKTQGDELTSICDINNGVHTQADYLSNKKFPDRNDSSAVLGSGIYVLDENFPEDSDYLQMIRQTEEEYLKPFFKNSDVSRYFSNKTTTKKLIYLNKRIHNIDELSNIKSHLKRFEDIIEKASDNAPYLHRPKNIPWLSSKIICPQRSKTNTFGYNEIPWYASADVYFITAKENSEIELKYILALLNSKLYYQWLYHRGKRKGETLELYQKPLSEIPIKKISPEAQKPFIDVVDQILEITSDSNYDPKNPPEKQKKLELKIDEMVMDLYELTKEEKEIIRNF